ncbi:hypothetical protein HMPREF9056_01327 [Actinomyces sp. oral taxon 170 str. F0386]|nr:hypothetical protein HMPREF9056_01327 [Actinomyces sp. oral taxon 170 str. F0386]
MISWAVWDRAGRVSVPAQSVQRPGSCWGGSEHAEAGRPREQTTRR